MNDQELRRLLTQYHEGKATPEEMAQLHEWYEQLQQPEQSFFKDEVPGQAQLQQLLQDLHHRMRLPVDGAQQPLRRKLPVYTWAAAAAIVLLLATGWWYLGNPQQKETPTLVAAGNTRNMTAQEWKMEQNPTKHTRILQLPDSSLVKLSAGALLEYKEPFIGSTKREVRVQGQVYIDVAKDKARPFTVYAGTLATTALGTSFSITARQDLVRVVLHTGKVVVQQQPPQAKGWKGNVYLLPGEQLQYNTVTDRLVLSKGKATLNHPVEALVFNDTPLPVVLQQLEKRYRTSIQYNAAALNEMYFSGSIQPTDAIAIVLQAIAQMNGLTITPEAAGFIVQVK